MTVDEGVAVDVVMLLLLLLIHHVVVHVVVARTRGHVTVSVTLSAQI